MRKNASSAWIKAAFLTIVVVFVFWGVGAVVGGKSGEVVARINGEVLTPAQLQRAYKNLQDAYRQLAGEAFTPELEEALQLRHRAFEELVRATLLRQEAEKLGLQATDGELREAIRSLPGLGDGQVGFDRERYVRLLRVSGYKPAEFEASQRVGLLVRKLEALLLAGVRPTDAQVRHWYEFENEKAVLRFVRVRASDFLAQAEPSEQEVRAYYEGHGDAFREPERVRAELVVYSDAAFEAGGEPSEGEIEQYYADHRAEYEKPEQVRARHILFRVPPGADEAVRAEKRKQAEGALARLRNGEDFAALARELSDDSSKENGGDLGFFTREQMVPPFAEAAFSLQPGETSGVVETQFGFHIVRVEEKRPGESTPLAQVREEIRSGLRREKASALRRERAAADAQRAKEGASLGALAVAAGLRLETIGPLARAASRSRAISGSRRGALRARRGGGRGCGRWARC